MAISHRPEPGMGVQRAPQSQPVLALLDREATHEALRPFLPAGTDIDRVIATAKIACRNTPQLLKCDPESVLISIARIQQWGLEIGTTAHLVPFGATCTPIADYKGLAELVIASGAVRHVEARCVYANEPFVFEQGLSPKLEHHPVHRAGDRGALIGAYVIFHLRFQVAVFEYMVIEDVDVIRKKYSKQWKEGPCPPWYAMKTVLRQAVKLLPKSQKLRDVLRVIDEDRAVDEGGNERPAGDLVAVVEATEAPEAPAAGEAREGQESGVKSAEPGNVVMPRSTGEARQQPASAPPPASSGTFTYDEADLARAMQTKLRGKPEKWGGKGGQPMGELDSGLLEAVRGFFAKQITIKGEEPALVEQVQACRIILADRERMQTTLALESEGDEEPDVLPAALVDEEDDGLPF